MRTLTEALANLFVFTIVLPTLVIGFFAAMLGLSQILAPDRLRHAVDDLRSWKINLRQVMIAIAVAALVLSVPASRSGVQAIVTVGGLCLWVVTWFIRNWRNEFVFLMELRDDAFPGRNDKAIWAAVLLVFPPVGFWIFRAYHLRRWPRPAPADVLRGARVERVRTTATQPA